MNPLAKKLQINPGKRWLFFNASANYLATIEPLPDGVTALFNPEGNFDGIQLFVKDSIALASALKTIAPLLKDDTLLWVSYPKKSSGIITDLEMMGSWDELSKYSLRIVASVAIDETWTALRLRPLGQSKLSDGSKESIRQNEYSEYIDVDNKQITLPEIIKTKLEQAPAALAFYHSLSYSNKKEYVLWILTAKQEKTRDERLGKMVEKLVAGKKNPSEK